MQPVSFKRHRFPPDVIRLVLKSGGADQSLRTVTITQTSPAKSCGFVMPSRC